MVFLIKFLGIRKNILLFETKNERKNKNKMKLAIVYITSNPFWKSKKVKEDP